MKEELEAEYLATFKKTVAMHEVFLTQMTTHPVFRNDSHLKVFLEFDQDLCANLKKKIDVFGGLMRRIGKTTDEILLGTTVKYDIFEKIRNIEGRVASGQDLMLGDTLRYYQQRRQGPADSSAALPRSVRGRLPESGE
ncbi:hypothetical protein pipiens_010765 [Culex pipiens pipiens]|uniref:PX domain-containing protein n=1 Tax=Culex pipiens pipiens TaxID=38569 RepID=A0ABD1D8W6_CULPP